MFKKRLYVCILIIIIHCGITGEGALEGQSASPGAFFSTAAGVCGGGNPVGELSKDAV
ncbi:MAG: hypothetical protein K6T65_05715 [Peptococcaceae bacterium]|nr:hypothetical protein [Peptococcaceae bacterium]